MKRECGEMSDRVCERVRLVWPRESLPVPPSVGFSLLKENSFKTNRCGRRFPPLKYWNVAFTANRVRYCSSLLIKSAMSRYRSFTALSTSFVLSRKLPSAALSLCLIELGARLEAAPGVNDHHESLLNPPPLVKIRRRVAGIQEVKHVYKVRTGRHALWAMRGFVRAFGVVLNELPTLVRRVPPKALFVTHRPAFCRYPAFKPSSESEILLQKSSLLCRSFGILDHP